MSIGEYKKDAKLECQDCDFTTTVVKEGMQHAAENRGHSIAGDGPIEGTRLTISLEYDEPDDEEPKEEREQKAFAMLRDAASVPPTVQP